MMIATHDPKKFPKPDVFIEGRRKRGSAGMEIRAYFQGRIAQARAKSAKRKS